MVMMKEGNNETKPANAHVHVVAWIYRYRYPSMRSGERSCIALGRLQSVQLKKFSGETWSNFLANDWSSTSRSSSLRYASRLQVVNTAYVHVVHIYFPQDLSFSCPLYEAVWPTKTQRAIIVCNLKTYISDP